MTPDWTSDDGAIQLYCGDCREVLPHVGKVDCIITDPPYSGRTHFGHDATANGHRVFGFDGSDRKTLGYSAWTEADVFQFVRVAHDTCDGWMVCMTDHVLAPHWHAAMSGVGRYTFAPLPWYVPGSRVRLSGDGPSSWTTWIVVSRTKKQSRWGTLPGGYTDRGEQHHMGGKPVELMLGLVGDYSQAGQLVCDPCAGSGTTGVACVRLGRRFIGIEKEPRYFAVAVKRIEKAILDHAGGPMFKDVDTQGRLL